MHFDARNLLILSQIPGIGPSRLQALVSHFKDPALILKATAKQLTVVEGIERRTAQSIIDFIRNGLVHQTERAVDVQLSRLNKVNGRIVTIWDDDYPTNLKRIYDPPPVLFVRGEFKEDDSCSVAIVGTREPSAYGSTIAERFSTELAQSGIPIISGLARGIDTIAHDCSLKAGGRTVAVLGSGIDVIYPPENKSLSERIIGHGAVISEFEMGAKPDAGNFPRRNRIISGISLATLVVETGVDGGAMITATTALDQNRDIFAIPSPVSEKRRSGTNLLIKEGKALLTESVQDIMEELAPRLKHILKRDGRMKEKPQPAMTLFEQQVYNAIGDEPIHIDLLAERAGLSTSDSLVQLLSMEFKGIVRQLPGKIFVKAEY